VISRVFRLREVVVGEKMTVPMMWEMLSMGLEDVGTGSVAVVEDHCMLQVVSWLLVEVADTIVVLLLARETLQHLAVQLDMESLRNYRS